jgi:NodT family efflux transporter outer membrane factor (OMF) lipoprotein
MADRAESGGPMRNLLLCMGAALWLYGCENGPMPQLPAGDIPKGFQQAGGANAPLWPGAEWWTGFGDDQLSRFMAEARANNLDMLQAAARLRQADARAKQAGAALLPSVGLNADINTLYGQAKGTSQHETDWSAALGASYELDFWGKNRDALDAANAARTASAADRATVGLTVSAGVANSYFQLLSLRQRIALARANLATSEQILRLVQRRVDAGYAANSDLTQERANMAAQRALIPALEQQELETRDALAVLLGRPPEGFSVTGDTLGELSGPAVVPGLPSELLTRRPDVMSAEANLAAAHANLAAARTAFLPNISLTANGGVAYPALAAAVDTLPGTGLTAGLGASLVQVIFDNGKIEGQVEEAKAHEEELLAAYRAAAIAAFSDVENAAGNLSHLTAQEAALKDQVAASQSVLAAAQRKYSAGYADFLVVTDAERSLNSARDQLADTRRARLAALVALYKALGGGWSSAAP